MLNGKKVVVVGFASLFISSLCVAGLVSAQIRPFQNKGEVLGSKKITVFDLDENGQSIPGTGKSIIKYAYKSDKRIEKRANEIVPNRTKHSRTFSLGNQNGREVYKTEIISGAPQYYKDGLGRWWQAEYATTTPEEFAKRDKSLKDKVLALLGVEQVWATTSTFYPDGDTESTSVDGIVNNYSGGGCQNWSTVINEGTGAGANSVSATSVIRIRGVGTNLSTCTKDVGRAVFLFDTSSVPDTSTINSGVLSVYGLEGTVNTIGLQNGSEYLSLVSSSPGSNTNITTSDYGSFGTTKLSNDFDLGSAFSNWSGSSYNEFNLNSSGLGNISKTGVSKFGIRFIDDVEATTPDASNKADSNGFVYMHFAEQTGTSNDPKLTVTYTLPSPPVISGVQTTDITNTSSVVTWTTDKSADSKVIYGTTNPVESSSPLLDLYNSNLVTSHSMSLTGLDADTTYYYKTVSTKDGVTATSSQSSFTTLQPSVSYAPKDVLYAHKDQDQFAISTDELFVDEDLKITLATSTTYIITGAITASSTAKRPDINMSFNSPSGSSMALTFGSFDGGAKVAGSGLFSSDASEVDIDLPSNGLVVIHINGSITTGATAGTLEFEWAQNTSSATAIKLFKGSYLRAEKIE